MDNSILGKRSYHEITSVVEVEQKGDIVQQPIIVEDIDFSDLNSLINFNRIYNLYYQCLESRNDSLRSQCVKFFVKYHKYKFIHYFDVQGYIKFIVDVFFDPEFNVFNNMSSFNCRAHNPTIQHIYNRIINDKRKRIEIYQKCCYFTKINRLEYDLNDFYNKLLSKNIDNENTVKHQINLNDREIQLENNSNTGSDSIVINKESKCILQDILLDKIISFSVVNLPTFNIKYKDVEIVLNIALVSKKIFKLVSKYIPNGYYLRGPINLQRENCIVQSPPLFFDYESIKYIKYGESTDRTNQLFSRVDEFHISSDEYDIYINDGVERFYINDETFTDNEDLCYRKSIESDRYLPHLPAMPNLKRITLIKYYGYESNYSSFLTSICKSTPSGDGRGIEQFKIDINKDWNSAPDFSNLDFLEPLIRLHSNTLKSIEIKYEYCRDLDMVILLEHLKDLIPTMEQHSYSFILHANYRKLKRVCQEDDKDRKVYQYLLNQKIKNNVKDYSDYSDFTNDDEDEADNINQ
ncbi:hypothetical protein PPL_07470 [Heterostelium album PN500]|uniref:Uncharacterized protein n=1 Tax=Heterostelium pallidum (strain ATCC 26659 / Pp 5 / PN500) TaxID=670386 RepID=D3BG19_HETP5|nr:hypothetical protein PPL_07470 [Heterostelium album PN500]EFA79611.1 hypothetical protein PPL_07470 [Heterostelium album PN500]|eukprot:XP_020431732.1 hypothetical protein PPL_07470 [Heterostelium album PN500]